MLLMTHPSNVEKIRQLSEVKGASDCVNAMHMFHAACKIVECSYMPPMRKSGMYSINGRGRYAKQDIKLVTKFVTYGPEDFDYLVYAGVVKELEEMNILMMDNSKLSDLYNPGPMINLGVVDKISYQKFEPPHDSFKWTARP